jgi:hypothetical protein
MDPSADELRAAQAEAKKLAEELNDVYTTNRNISSEILSQVRNTRNLTNATSQDVAMVTKVLTQSRKLDQTLNSQIRLLEKISKGLTKELDLTKEIQKNETLLIDLGTARTQLQNDLSIAQNELAAQQLNQISLQQQYQQAVLNGSIKQQNQLFQQLQTAKDNVEAEKDRVKQIQTNIDVTDRLIQNYQEGNDKLKEGVKLIQQQKKEQEELRKKVLNNVLSAITFGLTLRSLFDTFKALNKQQTETAQQLGISVKQAEAFGEQLGKVSGRFTDSNFALSTLLKGLQELNAELGTSLKFTEQEVVQFTELTKVIGLSTQEAAKLFTLSKLNNQTLKQTEEAIVAGTVASNRQYRVQISARDVMKDISKLSGGILVTFNQNPKALAAAVVQAKSLGMTLDQVSKIGESLLNFEQSIQSELEAELLTGKELNFEKARYYALTNDSVGLMNELAKQTGGLVEYNKMNRLQQESIAKTMGMSRDELSQTLIDQEKFSKLGAVAEKSAAEQLKYAQENGITLEQSVMKSLEQQAAQDRLNETFTKLKEVLVSIVDGPMGDFVRMLGKLLDNAAVLGTIMGVMIAGGIIKTIQGMAQMILLADKLRKIEQATAIAKGIGTALSNPLMLIGGLAAAGLVGATIMGATQIKDGGIDTGGRLIVSGPKGSFVTDKSDQIVAAPGVADAMKNGGGGGVTKEDLAALANRPVVVQANLSTGGDTIQKWQTSAGQYGNSGRFA